MLKCLNDRDRLFDFIIIGGGASGIGIALEAVTRGYYAVLFEKSDFAKSTSGKSTKLIHGGVRYLAQGNIALVREACIERGLLLKNAPHLVRNISFIIPVYGWFDKIFFSIGLTIYDLIAGKYRIGKTQNLSREETIRRLPTIIEKNLTGGILYHDGQFDDSRLAINLIQTAVEKGAVVMNYMPVISLCKNEKGMLHGVVVRDSEKKREYTVNGKIIINATGVFSDEIMQLDQAGMKKTILPSQGIHIVLNRSYLPGNEALMIPKTADGRVLFAIPWHGKVVVGTTDTPVEEASPEPVPLQAEIDFILSAIGQHMKKVPQRKDVMSAFAGLRALAVSKGKKQKSKEISRSHKIIVSPSGLLTIIGGKWTTFRKMAEDMISKAEKINKWEKTISKTKNLMIHGFQQSVNLNDPLHVYGSDKKAILELTKDSPELSEFLSESRGIIKAQVLWAVREEMALTVEDFLSRRTRCQLLDARESLRIAPETAQIMARELSKDEAWINDQIRDYELVTRNYILE